MGLAYPGATTFPGKGGILALTPDSDGTLLATPVTDNVGEYPGSFPGSYPGHGSGLGAVPLTERTLTAVPA